MKDFKEIRNEITANINKIEELETAANKLMKKAELKAAATIGDIKKIHASITDQDEAEAVKLYTEAENLERINKILAENEKASLCAYCEPIIKEIMQKYNGKQYGTKTADKISKAAKENGFYFYFSGYSYKYSIEIGFLNVEGCTDWNMPKLTIHATDIEGKTSAFINEKNTIQDFNKIVFSNNYTYTENPNGKQDELKKKFEEFKNLIELATKAQSELNKMLPEGQKHFYVVNSLSPFERV